ncbi:MAG: tripartite tricarboxylate transporter substrate binding protein [Fusobacterium perfoetens]|uniref:tripartite tricarboxylate transporter substrate binding protein n=1 Tax=Fusobacterium perfoetens TaxID=852 RepID=UPI0023F4E236|nr:tripartite tricarboxylate transporter substrate binding protein [Fusobacterium perfoetens]MCI6151627.1 tripartite tricarboxylate transporter substrate binding protein [Fusobacterium perfoetens]MDY3237795.1 tripartite tricarboxylate transporter substrate binding protein [Fusobacterium perfoetens]
MKLKRKMGVMLAGALLFLGIGSMEKTYGKEIDFPKKPVQLIVPLKAGGDTDYNARVLAKYMQKYLGKPVVVTNIDGGATMIGMQQILNSDPDGYSMVINGLDLYIPNMMGTTDITLDSFKTVGIPLFDNCTVLATNSASGYKDIKDLVEKTKKNPNKIEYGMKIGAANQIYGIAMNKEWDAKFKPVDVGNNAAKLTALLGRQTDSVVLTYALAKDYFEKGKFQALVLLGSEKNELLPNVPLASEYGLKDIDCSKFFWIGVHPDTPDEIVDVLADAMEKVTKDPEYIKAMESNYLTVRFIREKEAQDFANKFYEENLLKYKDEFLKK